VARARWTHRIANVIPCRGSAAVFFGRGTDVEVQVPNIGHDLGRRLLAYSTGCLAERPVPPAARPVWKPSMGSNQPKQPGRPNLLRGSLVIPRTTSRRTLCDAGDAVAALQSAKAFQVACLLCTSCRLQQDLASGGMGKWLQPRRRSRRNLDHGFAGPVAKCQGWGRATSPGRIMLSRDVSTE
jgi:hypothetical protein